MKKISILWVLIITLIMTTVLTGQVIFAADEITLLHDKVGNPNYQPYFEATGKQFKEDIGVGFKPVGYPTTDVFRSTVNSSLPTKDAPDIFTWWSTYWAKDLIDQGLVKDLSPIWDKYKDDYPQGVRDAFTFDGKTYGFPWSMEYWTVFYNKDVFKKYNLSVPKTWEEFLEVCATLKDNDVTPLNQTIVDEWPAFIWYEEIVGGLNPQLYKDLNTGNAKFTDEETKEAFSIWGDMIKKGYFTNPSLSYFADMPRMFNDGQLGMILAGTWYYSPQLVDNGVPAAKVGQFDLPSVNKDAGDVVIMELQPIFVSANGKHTDEAMKVADYWMSAEGNSIMAKEATCYPSNPNAETDFLPEIKQEILNNLNNNDYQYLNRFWEAMPTELMLKVNQKFGEFIMYPDKQDEVLEGIQQVVDNYWASQK